MSLPVARSNSCISSSVGKRVFSVPSGRVAFPQLPPGAEPIHLPDGITVFDEDRNGVADTDEDSWLYTDPDTDRPYLLIRYLVQDGHHNAYLIDDLNENGQVDVSIADNRLTTALVQIDPDDVAGA